MRILKSETVGFSQYQVTYSVSRTALKVIRKYWWHWIFAPAPEVVVIKERVPVLGLVEADDQTGLIIRQVFNEYDEPLYTDGVDDVALDNTARILMCTPTLRDNFVSAGFRPKLVTSYEQDVQILHVPTIAVAKIPEVVAA